jgi:hypothetical protein
LGVKPFENESHRGPTGEVRLVNHVVIDVMST